ncbi:MAG TPA: tripartite tricarboxylate transporter TctB family protein [Casimicrobiaceae bacterium]
MRRRRLSARLGSAIPYALLLGGAAYLYVNAAQFAALAKPGELGPGFWPRAILGVLMLVCAVAIGRSLVSSSPVREPPPLAGAQPEVASERTHAEGETEPARHPYLLIAGIALSAGYVAGLEWLGFFVATALYLGLFMGLGRYPRRGVIASVSLVGSLAFVVVFMKIVYVSLPLGVGPFQAISVAILAALGIR